MQLFNLQRPRDKWLSRKEERLFFSKERIYSRRKQIVSPRAYKCLEQTDYALLLYSSNIFK